MIGDESTGVINIKSNKINACTQPHASTWFVLKKNYINTGFFPI